MALELHQYQSLLKLSRSPNLYNGKYTKFIKEAVQNLASILEVPRVSFWLFNEQNDAIINQIMFFNPENKFVSGEIMHRKKYPKYFLSFKKDLLINAENAQSDPRTSEFLDSYLIPNDIKSMLDTQVSIEGKLFGIICLEQTHESRQWTKIEELYTSAVASYLAQAYIAKCQKEEQTLRFETELKYKNIFNDSPIPMWVYDPKTLKFLEVNASAINNYGFSEEEFLNMTIMDIRPTKERALLKNFLKEKGHRKWISSNWHHQYKNGEIISVEIASDWTVINNKKVRLVIALNKTSEKKLFQQKENYIKKLREFAFYASHNLRGPIATLLGLNSLLKIDWENREGYEKIIENIKYSIIELDEVVKDLSKKIDL